MAYISFTDEILGSETQFRFSLKIVQPKISVRQLICSRVEAEVDKINKGENQPASLVRPAKLEEILNGPKKKKVVDVEKQKKVALKAFESNGFLMFINDEQVTDLDEDIPLTNDLTVKFLKLVQLVGG